MKRAGRWLFNFAAAVSLVLCVAMFGLGVRSFWVADLLSWMNGNFGSGQVPVFITEREVLSNRGVLTVILLYTEYQGSGAGIAHPRFGRYQVDPIVLNDGEVLKPEFFQIPTSSYGPKFLRFMTINPGINSGDTARELDISLWILSGFMGVLPTIWIVRWRRLGSRAAGFCPACGYDLRATPDRCPECGAVPEVRSSKIHTDL